MIERKFEPVLKLILSLNFRSLNPPTGGDPAAEAAEPSDLDGREAEPESNLTPSFNLPNLPEPSPEEVEPKFVPSNHEFARTLLWNFEDIRMLIGFVFS